MQPGQKFRGRRLRLLYGLHVLLRRLGLAGNPEKLLAQPIAVRKANKAPGWTTFPPPPDVVMSRQTIAGRSAPIEIKKYLPPRLNPQRPRVFFIHGGGWAFCGLDTLDHLCASVSREAQCLVISVDYRLAPETKFPGALEDCDDAFVWAASDPSLGPLPPSGMVVMGESAGGNLAAALCVLRAQRGQRDIARQILLYPALDGTLSSESVITIDQPGLERSHLTRVLDLYRGNADIRNPLLSPMFADNFAQLPPALIVTADIDPLRDDGATFAKKLNAAGVTARHVNYLGMPHGFFFMPRICGAAAEGIRAISAEISAVTTTNRSATSNNSLARP